MARTTSAKTSTTDKKKASRTAKSEATPKATAGDGQGDGTEEVATAIGELTVAGAMEDVAAAELAAGVADLTRAADAAVVAERMGRPERGRRRRPESSTSPRPSTSSAPPRTSRS